MASRVARLYRETLKRCRHLGGERGLGARLDAQHFYTQFRSATDATAVDALAAAAESRLGYLRMVTPKFSGGRRVGADDGSAARAGKRGSFVVRDGVLQPRVDFSVGAKPISGFGGNNPDPDFVAKHNYLMERQHFGGDFWRSRGVTRPPRSPVPQGRG